MGEALLTDFYELTMAASYLRRGMAAPATFSLFVRRLPPTRGFLVAAGLEDCLDYLERLHFEEEDLAYLAGLGFEPAVLDALGAVSFTGDVWAVPEGRVVVAGEPLLEVTAPVVEAQLVETWLLNRVSHATAIASKAARCVVAAAGRMELVDFGFRRTQGLDAGMTAARVSAMVGFAATSNVEAARVFGLAPSGTMAHSYVEAFPTELAAFRAFAEDLPDRTTFLVDTYDTVDGVVHAIEVVRELGLEQRAAIRLDSGDLVELSRRARGLLDEAGLPGVRIVVSGSLDEHHLAQLVAAGAPVDVAGVGTRMGVSADAPYLDTAYKLVEYAGRPVMKLSPGKHTLPGAKQVFRRPGLADTLALRHEEAPDGASPLLEPVMVGGRRTRHDTLAAQRARVAADLAHVPPRALELQDPAAPEPVVSRRLAELSAAVEHRARGADTP